MNKVFNINLGGYPFTIDEDAYEHLSKYLKAIHRHFESSEGYEEITGDIEARLAELFQEQQSGRPIVTIKDVKSAIAVMGTPEEFGAQPLEDEEPKQETETNEKKSSYRTGKRLFRNSEDEVVGGVCSGIAAYFGIQDPLWVRIAFIVLTISGGLAIPAYLILWAVLPKAETAGDRLAMRGEPINVSNIGKIVEEEIDNLTKRMSDLGDEISDKFGDQFKNKKKSFGSQTNFKEPLARGISGLGSILRGIIRLIQKIGRPFLVIIGIILIASLAMAWLASVIGLTFGLPFVSYLSPTTPGLVILGGINILLFIGLPLLGLALLVARLLFGTRVHQNWKAGFIGLFIANSIVFFGLASRLAPDFNDESYAKSTELINITSDTVYLKSHPETFQYPAIFSLGPNLQYRNEKLYAEFVEWEVVPSPDGQFRIVQELVARGRNIEEAEETANRIDYQYEVQGSDILIPKGFFLPKGEKFRGQHVKARVEIPEGKVVKLDRDILHSTLHYVKVKGHDDIRWASSQCQEWTMGPEGLSCPDLDILSDQEVRVRDIYDFQRLRVDGPITLNIVQAHTYDIDIKNEDLSKDPKIEINKLGDMLDIQTNQKDLVVTIKMPYLERLDADHTTGINLTGFEQPEMTLFLDTKSEVKGVFAIDHLTIKQQGSGKTTIRGQGDRIDAHLENRVNFDASAYHVADVEVSAKDDASAQFIVSGTIKKDVKDQAQVSVEGNPSFTTIQ